MQEWKERKQRETLEQEKGKRDGVDGGGGGNGLHRGRLAQSPPYIASDPTPLSPTGSFYGGRYSFNSEIEEQDHNPTPLRYVLSIIYSVSYTEVSKQEFPSTIYAPRPRRKHATQPVHPIRRPPREIHARSTKELGTWYRIVNASPSRRRNTKHLRRRGLSTTMARALSLHQRMRRRGEPPSPESH